MTEQEGKVLSVYEGRLLEMASTIPDEIRSMTDRELDLKINPTLKMYELRRSFWAEQIRASEGRGKMVMANVYRNIFGRDYFYKHVMSSHMKMEWIMRPLAAFDNKAKALLEKSYKRLEEIIGMPLETTKMVGKGKDAYEVTEVDPRKATVVLAAHKIIEDRALGKAIERSVGITTSKPDTKKKPELDMSKIDQRIKELQEKVGMDGLEKHSDILLLEPDGHSHGENRGAADQVNEQTGASQSPGSPDLRRGASGGIVDVKPEDIRRVEKTTKNTEG